MTKRSLIPAVALFAFMAVSNAQAQVPKVISYQGIFADQAGLPVSDGDRSMKLSIYDAPTGGNILYTETQTVKFVHGVFNVGIGSVTPLPNSLRFDRPYYLGVTVENNPEFSPRTQLTTSPFAMRSLFADVADSLSPNARGVVTNVNGQSGSVNIVGSGNTHVAQAGNTITINSDGVSSVNGVTGNVDIVGAGGTTITRSGNRFTITTSGTGLKGVVALDPSIYITDGGGQVAQIGVSELGITTQKIADEAVTSAKLANGAITDSKIAIGGINYSKITGAPTSLPPSGPASGDLTGTYPNPTITTNAVTTAKIADGSVTTPKIADGAATTVKIADGSIITQKVADGGITDAKVANGISYSKLAGAPTSLPPSGPAAGDLVGTYPNPSIATNAVTSTKIADGSVTTPKILDAAVTTPKIIDGAITTIKLSDGSATTAKIADGAATTAKLADGSVTTVKVADSSITNAKVASGIAYSKLSGAPTSLPPSGPAAGDLSGLYPNPNIATGAVTSNKIADGTIIDADVNAAAAIAYSKLNLNNSIQNGDITANAVTTSKVANGTVTTSKMADSAISGLKILTNAVNTAHIADGAVTLPKISSTGAATNQSIIYNGTSIVWGSPTPAGAAGGDLTGTYPNPTVANSSITSAKILDGTIVDADVSPTAAIAYSKLALNNSIQNGDITANAITTSKVANGTVTTSKMADSAISGLKILTYAVTTNHIADGAVNSAKITDGTIVDADVSGTAAIAYSKLALNNSIQNGDITANAITTSKVANGTVTTSKMADSAISGLKLLTYAVSTNHIADGAVTLPKISSTGAATNQSIIYNGTSIVWGSPTPAGAAGGDLTGTYPNPTVANSSITSAKILDGTIVDADVSPTAAIAYSKLTLNNSIQNGDITANAITTSKVANGTVTTSKMADSAISGLKLLTFAVTNRHIADGAVTNNKISGTGASTNDVLTYNGSNVVWSAPATGATGAAGGDLTGTYPNPTVANSAITSAKILDGTIVDADVSPTAAIAYSKLALNNSIQNGDITANAITTSKVANGTVTTSKMADSAISGLKILTYAVTTNHIADGAVNSAKITDGTIVDADVSGTAAIAYSKLALNNGIQNGDITANAITTSKVANGTVTTSKMADSAISGLKLLTFAVTNRHIADGAVTNNKISGTGASTNDVLTYNGTSVVWSAPATGGATGAAGGDLTGTYPNPTLAANSVNAGTIADGTITNADIIAGAGIPYSKLTLSNSIQNLDIVANAITTSKVANGTVTTSKMADSAISGLKLLTFAVTNRHIADGAVTNNKISGTGASTNDVLTYNGTSVVWSAPATGGATGAAGGDLTGTYPNPTLAANSVNAGTIADGTITNADIIAGAGIPYSKLTLSNSIQNLDIVANAITTSKVANGTVTTSKMADSAISGLKLLTFAVTNRHLATNAVTNDKISGSGASNGQVLMYNSGTNTVAWSNPAVGLAFSRAAISNINSPYTVPAGTDIVGVDVTAGPVTVTLPPANSVPSGKILIVKNELGNAATNNITIQRNGTDLINAASTQVTISAGTGTGSFSFYSDGVSRWHQY